MDTPEDVVLPCGCFVSCAVVDGVNEMRLSPCHMDCGVLREALGLADEGQVPVEFEAAS